MWGARGSLAVTMARKSSKECIGNRPHIASPKRHQHVAWFKTPVQLRDRIVEPGRASRPYAGPDQSLHQRPGFTLAIGDQNVVRDGQRGNQAIDVAGGIQPPLPTIYRPKASRAKDLTSDSQG